MVATGSTLTLIVHGTTGQWVPRTAGEVRGSVLSELGGAFYVYDLTLTRATWAGDPENLYYWNWDYDATITLQTRGAYADAQDVAAIVANAFYGAAGSLPTVTVRGDGPQQGGGIDYTGLGLAGALAGMGVVVAVVGVGALYLLYGPKR